MHSGFDAGLPLHCHRFIESLGISILSQTEVSSLAALSACSTDVNALIQSLGWRQACRASPQTAYAPWCITYRIEDWYKFLHDRTPITIGNPVRVLGEDDLRVNEQLDWAALVAVIGPFRSGKSSLVQRLVRQEAPGQSRYSHWPPVGSGIRACVVEAFGLRGRLRLFEIDERQTVAFGPQLRKADAVLVLCDQAEGVEGAGHAMQLLDALNGSPPFESSVHRPCFFVLAKSDLAKSHEDVHAAVRALQLQSSESLSNCEVVSISAMTGMGMDLLLHLLALRLVGRGSPSRQQLLQRSYLGGCKLLHRTAGAMYPHEVLGAILRSTAVRAA